eukprot:scaffold34181_cov36-Phaeocystis_antarctica.AAC.1
MRQEGGFSSPHAMRRLVSRASDAKTVGCWRVGAWHWRRDKSLVVRSSGLTAAINSQRRLALLWLLVWVVEPCRASRPDACPAVGNGADTFGSPTWDQWCGGHFAKSNEASQCTALYDSHECSDFEPGGALANYFGDTSCAIKCGPPCCRQPSPSPPPPSPPPSPPPPPSPLPLPPP